MSKLTDKWIDLFRAGDYGDKGAFTEGDVQRIVDNYDPAVHEAPSAVGHTESSSPAYGWWSKLRRVGGLLQGQQRDVNPAFEEAVESGAYKKRSVELYKGANGHSLRRVCWLGADPPEVKGLANVEFSDEDKAAIEIEFSEETFMELKEADKQSVVDAVVSRIQGLFKPAADQQQGKAFSEDEVKRIVAEAVAAAVPVAVAPLQAEIATHKATFSEQQKVAASASSAGRAQAAIAQVKAMGAWVPAFDRMGVPELFSELAKGTETIEFSEGTGADAAKVKKTPLEVLTTFMEGLGKIVPTAAVFTGKKQDASAAATQFNESGRVKADPNSIALDQAVKVLMSEGAGMDYGTALNRVTRERPELCQPGGASAGQV